MTCTRLKFGLTFVTMALAVASQADTLYDQPFMLTANGGYFASAQAGYVQFDSFNLATNATVDSVSWYGVDLNELINLTPINPTSFDIGIYADNGAGLPGTLLSATTVGNSGNATNTGQQLMGLTLYSYSADLTTSFAATANTKYWLKIIDPTSNNDWFWASGSGPDGNHAAQIGGSWGTYADDMSFTLTGTAAPVPEPATMAALGLGLAAFARKRRKH